MAELKADVVVLGAGMVGVGAALHLQQRGRDVAALAGEGISFQIHWNPFQLNPDMPKEGRDRAAYRAWKFGSADKAAALDQRTAPRPARCDHVRRSRALRRNRWW